MERESNLAREQVIERARERESERARERESEKDTASESNGKSDRKGETASE